MTTLPSMGLTLPTRGAGGAGAWGDTLDADLTKLDGHRHVPGEGPRIPTAGIALDADLPFSALWAPTQLHRVQFSAIAVSTITGGMTKSLFVSDGTGGLVANELYYRTNAGASVQITSGSSLNVGAFVAGIGGDYAGVGAQLNYTDSSKTYDFKESTADSHAWARVQCGGIRLIEFNTTEAFFIAQIAPAALASSYTVTWPTALPGATTNPVFVDSTGQLSFPSTPTFPGAVTFSGLITASAGLTAAANQHVTLSGTGVIKHDTYTQQIASADFASTSASVAWNTSGLTGAPLNCIASISLPQGERIKAIRVFILDSVTGPTKLQASLITTAPDGTVVTVASSSVSAGSGANQTLTISALTTTIAANLGYAISVATTTGSAACIVRFAEVDYDHP